MPRPDWTPNHAQNQLFMPSGEFVSVDAGITDLLVFLWFDLGVCTTYSCQGGWVKNRPTDRDSYWTRAYVAYRAEDHDRLRPTLDAWQLPGLVWEMDDRYSDRPGGPQWCVRWDSDVPPVGVSEGMTVYRRLTGSCG